MDMRTEIQSSPLAPTGYVEAEAGRLYDAEPVGACLKLVRTQGFELDA